MSIETFPYQPSALGNFILGESILGYVVTGNLTDIIPAYLYQQYADDADLQAFIASYNAIAQGYLDWFNNTPLSVYTDQSINGYLLDWVGLGIYGTYRPVIATSIVESYGYYNSFAFNTSPFNTLTINKKGTAFVASDDIYKRTLTWNLYQGDGNQISIPWLKNRVARFLYGINGTGVSLSDALSVSILFESTQKAAGFNDQVFNEALYAGAALSTVGQKMVINVPNSTTAQTFKILFESGVLGSPMQVNFTVNLI